jgi:hypothetical protein
MEGMAMSLYHANITWQSPDGTWSTGFSALITPDGDGPWDQWEHEWDAEYGYGTFEAVYTGHPDEDAAMDAAVDDHGNPGTFEVERPVSYPAREAYDERIANLDAMAGAARAKAGRS